MEALVALEPGRFEVREVAVPAPGPNEVLARVRAVSICGTDAHLIAGDYPGFWPPAFPFTPGHEWAGELVALGPGAERYGWGGGGPRGGPPPAPAGGAGGSSSSAPGPASRRPSRGATRQSTRRPATRSRSSAS